MKYLKYYETYISGEAGYIVDFREIQRILKILGWEVNWDRREPNKIKINLNCIKIPYSILYLLLINNTTTEAYPKVDTIKNGEPRVLEFVYLDTNKTKDTYDDYGAPYSYGVGKNFGKLYNKHETTLTNSIEKISALIKIILCTSPIDNTTNFRINNTEFFDRFLQDSIIEFLNNPNSIPVYLLNIVQNNINNNTNSYSILNKIKEEQPFIYNQLLTINKEDIEKGNTMGEMGFGD